MQLILTVLAVFVLLMISEIWHRRWHVHGELSRKFVHITVGSFVAFWPYFLSVNQIKLLSLAFLVVAVLSKYLHIFQAVHSVQRPTWGEFWFALVVGLLAFILPDYPHIYTAALLEMSLADGLAAVFGTRYGNRYRYVVFESPKTLVGTATFFLVSCVILVGYNWTIPGMLTVHFVVLTALAAALIENAAAKGLDNLAVPLFVAVLLRLVV